MELLLEQSQKQSEMMIEKEEIMRRYIEELLEAQKK